jgi:hypothetical protein
MKSMRTWKPPFTPIQDAYMALEVNIAWCDCVADGTFGNDYNRKRALSDIIKALEIALAALKARR